MVVTIVAASLDRTGWNKTKFIIVHIWVEHSWLGESRCSFYVLFPGCHWSTHRGNVVVSGQTSLGLEVWFSEISKLVFID